MAGRARQIVLTEEQRQELESWLRYGRDDPRLAKRAHIVFRSAAGATTMSIARMLRLRPSTVSKWRIRFANQGLAGLSDAPRCGAPCKYGADTERRILGQIENPPPDGSAAWTGKLVASALGDVSCDQVWRVLRRHGINLRDCRHRRSQTAIELATAVSSAVR